ncbi:HET domain-containing protein [Fusarium sp. LHS14.1]|nr:HET domain-containing protein [Fusarium sp. LHS14.1]
MKTMDLDHFIQGAKEHRLHTCKHCQIFVIDISNVRGPNICTHRTSGKQVFDAAADNCTFFKFCISTIKALVPNKENLATQLITKDTAETATLTVKVRHRRSGKVDTLYFMAGWEIDGVHDDLGMHDEFFSLTPSANISRMSFAEHPFHPVVNSEETFRKSSVLLQECLASHAECSKPSHMKPPSRLIEVGKDSQTIRLVSTTIIATPTWAALSYCWGGPQKMETTIQNVAARQNGFLISDLPLTIRDAIFVCRKLAISHIWIDSLCIIQDDQNDKVQELAKMPDIYQGALITISASSSSACTEGFLHDRSPYLPGVAFPLKYHDDYGMAQVISIDGFKTEPIDTRAWTFQEQVLSERWVDQMSQYSSRSLTFQRDKLNAIAGVASRFAQASGLLSTEYIIELWRPVLISGLLWYTARHEAQEENDIWVAPSWSWASVQGQVRWDRSVREFDATAQALSTDVQLTTESLPFGSVEAGRIVLKGCLTQITRHFPGYPRLTFPHGPLAEHKVVLRTDNSKKEGMASELKLWLLELASQVEAQQGQHPDRRERKRTGLILKPTGNRNEFERVDMYEEGIPLSKCEEEVFPTGCKRCNVILEGGDVVVELV